MAARRTFARLRRVVIVAWKHVAIGGCMCWPPSVTPTWQRMQSPFVGAACWVIEHEVVARLGERSERVGFGMTAETRIGVVRLAWHVVHDASWDVQLGPLPALTST